MKTITIPTYNNPFIVVINNKVYQYKAGETIEVPDEVAEAIEDALELVPKPRLNPTRLGQALEDSVSEITSGDLVGVKTIVPYALCQRYSLKSIDIPDSLTSIGNSAFAGCSGLQTVRCGHNSKLDRIGSSTFNLCKNLTSVYLPTIPPALANIDAFANINASCVFYCKTQASLDAYKAATNWSTLTGTYSFVVEA